MSRVRAVTVSLWLVRMSMIVGMLHAPVVDMSVRVAGGIHGVTLLDVPKLPNAD